MDFVEDIRVGKERTETRFGAEEDRPPAIGCTWIILRVGIAKDPPAEGDELFVFFWLRNRPGHVEVRRNAIPPHGNLLHFRNEDLIRTDRQSAGRFVGVQPFGAREQDAQFFSLDLFDA